MAVKRNTLIHVVLIVVLVLTVGYIFSNSLPDQQTSTVQSENVSDAVQSVLGTLAGNPATFGSRIRKLAHLVEFALLGLELALLFRRRLCLPPVFVALLVALMDETVQIFTKRGPQVQDVWLDFVGGCIGLAVGWAAYRLYGWLRKKRKTV